MFVYKHICIYTSTYTDIYSSWWRWKWIINLCVYMYVNINEWVTNLTMNESCHTCEWVMSHIWLSHVIHMNESCYTCEWVTSHMSMSHVTHVNESCRICEWVISKMWMSHVTHVNKSCRICERVMSHMWTSHVTHVNESCRIQGGEDPQDVLNCRSFSAKEPLIIGLFCGNLHIKIRHPMGLRHPVWKECCSNHIRAIQKRDMSHMYESCHTCTWVMSHMWTSHVTHVNESCHTCEWVMSHIRRVLQQ